MICHYNPKFFKKYMLNYTKNSKMAKTAYIEAWCKLTYSFEDLISSKELIDKVSKDRSN